MEIKIHKIDNNFSEKEILFLEKIIKDENKESIIASLNKKLLKKYLHILINSKNFFIYLCKYKNDNIGYIVFVKRPSFLIKDLKQIKFSIIFNLLFNLRLKTLLNVIISVLKLDLLFLKKNKDLIENNLNLNLFAIKKNYQSKGIGKKFLSLALIEIKKNQEFKKVTVEAPNNRVEKFYKEKNNFYYIGKKVRLFKNQIVLCKDL